MFCSNCGKELADGAKFCPDCGTPIVSGENALTAEEKTEKADTKKLKTKKRIIIPVIIILVVIIAAVGGIAFYMSPGQQYKRAMNKGDSFMSEKAYSDAIICYENALDIQKSREAEKALVKAYIKYAEECAKQEKYDEAIDNFLNALDEDEDNDDALEGLMNAYVGFGNQKLESKAYKEAEEKFKNALDLDENNQEALKGIVNCYLGFAEQAVDSGDYDKALEWYDEVLFREEDNASAFRGKAHVTALQGNVNYAMELIEEGLGWNADNGELLEEREYLIENSVISAMEMVWSDGSYSREEYNDADVCVKRSGYDNRGSLTYETEYDEEGKLQWSKSYDSKGNVTYEDIYEYDEKGKMIRCLYTNNEYPEESNRYEYEYDGNGNLLKQTGYSSSDQLTSIYIYEYDEKNQQTLSAYYYYSYDSQAETIASYSEWEANTYTYDEHGNIATREYSWGYENDNGIRNENLYSESYARWYDDNGNVTACTITDSNGGNDNTTYSYDAQGNVLSKEHTYENGSGYRSRDIEKYEYYEDGTESWYWMGEYNGDTEDELTAVTESYYDEAGNIISNKYESHSDYSDYYSYSECEYDEHSNRTKEVYESNYGTSVYEYENSYDAFDNLVRVYEKSYGNTTIYRYEYRLLK